MLTGITVPDHMPICGEFEPQFKLICHRSPEHLLRHYGGDSDGVFQGYWGEGVLHVDRVQWQAETSEPRVPMAELGAQA